MRVLQIILVAVLLIGSVLAATTGEPLYAIYLLMLGVLLRPDPSPKNK
jgi:hypothetical protein